MHGHTNTKWNSKNSDGTDTPVKVKWSRYRLGVAQRVGRDKAQLFHDRGTRRGWVVSSTPRPHFTPGKDPVPILQEVGWAKGLVWTGGKSRPHPDSIPDRPARSSVATPTELPGPLYTSRPQYIWKATLNMTSESKALVLWLWADRTRFRIVSTVLKKTCILQDVAPCRWIRWHFTSRHRVACGFVETDRASVQEE